MNETSFIDDIMGFNPQDLTVFNEPVSHNQNNNIYKTNPKLSKTPWDNYVSKVRIVYNPFNISRSIVPQTSYAMNDFDGFFMVKSSLADGNRECPIFKSWKKLRYADDTKKEWAKQMYDKTESQWVLVQILEDENQPDLVGQFKVMKLPKPIFEKMSSKMNPSDPKKTPLPIMDYIFGLPLEIEVQPGPDDPKSPSRRQREISYSLCDFAADYEPIIKVDGTPLFDDAEMELIDAYATAKAEFVKAKTEAKKAEKQKIINDNFEAIRGLYRKALDYIKEHAIDLVAECAYTPWDEATTTRVQHWIEIVADMKDPKTMPYDVFVNGKSSGALNPNYANAVVSPQPQDAVGKKDSLPDPGMSVMTDDDVPF